VARRPSILSVLPIFCPNRGCQLSASFRVGGPRNGPMFCAGGPGWFMARSRHVGGRRRSGPSLLACGLALAPRGRRGRRLAEAIECLKRPRRAGRRPGGAASAADPCASAPPRRLLRGTRPSARGIQLGFPRREPRAAARAGTAANPAPAPFLIGGAGAALLRRAPCTTRSAAPSARSRAAPERRGPSLGPPPSCAWSAPALLRGRGRATPRQVQALRAGSWRRRAAPRSGRAHRASELRARLCGAMAPGSPCRDPGRRAESGVAPALLAQDGGRTRMAFDRLNRDLTRRGNGRRRRAAAGYFAETPGRERPLRPRASARLAPPPAPGAAGKLGADQSAASPVERPWSTPRARRLRPGRRPAARRPPPRSARGREANTRRSDPASAAERAAPPPPSRPKRAKPGWLPPLG